MLADYVPRVRLLFVWQRATEGPPILLCAWCDWWAEQPTCRHYNTGTWFPSGPGHWPLSGAQEWGISAVNFAQLTVQFTPVCCQTCHTVWRPNTTGHRSHVNMSVNRADLSSLCQFITVFPNTSMLFASLPSLLLLDLWANLDLVPERDFWVQIHADWSELVQLLLWSTSSQGQSVSDSLTCSLLLYLLFSHLNFAFWHQVALLDFGATRGFDKSFTDTYIEVRSWKTVSVTVTVGFFFYPLIKTFVTTREIFLPIYHKNYSTDVNPVNTYRESREMEELSTQMSYF